MTTLPGAIATSWKVTLAPLLGVVHTDLAWKKLSETREFRASTIRSVTKFADGGMNTMCVPPRKEKPNASEFDVHVDDTITLRVQICPTTHFESAFKLAS